MSISNHSITVNTIQTHKQRIMFDGKVCLLQLDFPPEMRLPISIVYSSGYHPPYHVLGQPGPAYEVLIDPDPKLPTISFPDVFWPGFYADIEYSYDFMQASPKALAHSLASAHLSHYGKLSITPGYNFDLAAPPDEKPIQVPAAFVAESDRLDYYDIKQAMIDGKELDFSQVNWIVYHEEQFEVDEYIEWYNYALDHCPRFAKEHPRR